jgi:hypothetical protein
MNLVNTFKFHRTKIFNYFFNQKNFGGYTEMKMTIVAAGNENPICYLPRFYTMKGQIIKNVAQKIARHHSPILKVDLKTFEILRQPNLNRYIEEKLDEQSKKLFKALIEKYAVYFVNGAFTSSRCSSRSSRFSGGGRSWRRYLWKSSGNGIFWERPYTSTEMTSSATGGTSSRC